MSKKSPALSFIIPVYNKPPEVFKKCLQCLYEMSFADFEIIAVFDGPDADLEAVAKKFPIQTVVIEHGGAPKARNEGFKLSKGRYVSFWDADCYAKPEMARVWMDTFARNPDAAFVYSGYEFSNEGGAYNSEPFDEYSLQCGNFIATMFPMKREVFPGFDESLKAAQDWDLWLTIVENGGKGIWIQGTGFVTEPSLKGSISFEGWSPANRAETMRIVREKHKIPQRDIAVGSSRHFVKALHLAKLLNADIIKDTSPALNHYKVILSLGYGPLIRFEGASPDCVKIQYWVPWDIDCIYDIRFKTARETLRLARKEASLHWCNEIVSQKRLEDLEIQADVVPLPSEIDDLESSLPVEFRVLVDADKAHIPVLQDLQEDLPHIPIDFLEHSADIQKYSVLLSFHESPSVDEGIRRFLLNGRHVISNVEAPFCGYLPLDVDYSKFKASLFASIRDARGKSFNAEAQEYYKTVADPQAFKNTVHALVPRLEVVS